MEAAEEPNAPRRPREPIAAVLATLVGAAAVIAYSGYWFGYALDKYQHCNPAPASAPCTSWSFWGFDPTFFLLAVLVGFAAGGALTVLAFLLWARPHDHTAIGALILSFSVVSVLAYGGFFVGIAAGLAGGILALLFRPPRFREMTQWSAARPTGRVTDSEILLDRRGSPTAARRTTPATSPERALTPDAYAPMPPARRPYGNSPAAAAGAVPAARSVPPTAAPPPAPRAFGSLSEALGARSGGGPPTVAARPAPVGTPPPHPMARPRPPAAAAPATDLAPAAPAPVPAPAPPFRDLGTGGPSVGPPAPTGGTRTAWKCARCGLTNAPWSISCTRCKSPPPAAY